MTDSDATLLTASRAGDVDAFGALIERYHNLVCAIAYARTGDRIASEDIAQETFLAAWRGIGTLRDADKLRPWLCGIARNLAGKTLRQRRRNELDVLDVHATATPLDTMLSKEAETAVWDALEKLPATYREPLVLFYREEQSIRQVALGLGLSEETAKQRLSRGRMAIKANMGELVEQTLEAGRPRKAAAAAVLAAILAARGTTPAVAATRTTGRKLVFAGGGTALLCAAAGIAIVATRSPDEPATPGGHDLGALREAHAAYRASHAHRETCAFTGTVARVAGGSVEGALVALLEHSWTATALDPIVVESDASGGWRLPPVASGTYSLLVSAPGLRAQTRVVTCASTAQAFSLATGGATVRGTVSDAGGGAVAGANVWVGDPRQPAATFLTRTRVDGSYELTVSPGLYVAFLSHPDYTLDVRPLTLGSAGSREDITMLPGASIEGRVVDAGGAPVAGARVAALPPTLGTDDVPRRWQLASLYAGLIPAISDDTGTFRLRGLPPGTHRLVARTAELATTSSPSVTLALAQQATGATIAVAPARRIEGFVVARGAANRGLANVQLAAIRDDAPFAVPMLVTTDGAGHFVLGGLAPGAYRITALASGYAPHVAEAQITISERDVVDSVIVLERGVTVSGSAAAGASVMLAAKPSSRSIAEHMRAAMTRAEIDERGTFTFAAVAPGDYVLSATTFEQRGELPLSVAASAPPSLRVSMTARPAITGTVSDETGAALANVLVAATSSRGSDPIASMHTTVRTDSSGHFTLVGVAPGAYRLRVFDARGQRAWAGAKRPFRARRVELPATGTVTEELVVARATARITGIVVDADRRPVADSWIDVRERDASHRPELFGSSPILTDDSGRFVVDDLSGNDFLVEAASPDGTRRAAVTASPGTDLTLQLLADAAVTGTVTHASAPVDAFEVRIRHIATGTTRRERGTAGSFTTSLMTGEHELVVVASAGYVKQTIAIGAETATSLSLSLVPWASVRGRIVGADGQPWTNASVIVDEWVEPTVVRTDDDGRFSIDRMVAGPNALSIHHATARDQFRTIDIELAPGDTLVLDHPGTSGRSLDLGLAMTVTNGRLVVSEVVPNGPAARAGLRAGDHIVGVGMSTISVGEEAIAALASLTQRWRSKGRAVTWTVVRDGREVRLDVLVPE